MTDPTLDAVLRAGAGRHPDTPLTFVADDGTEETTTAAEVVDAAGRLAAALGEAGLQPGDAVAVRGGSAVPVATATVAAHLGGFVAVPVLHTLGEQEVAAIVDRARARAFVTTEGFRDRDHLAETDRLLEARPALLAVARHDRAGTATLRWSDVLAGAPPAPTLATAPHGAAGADAAVFYTSGSSGRPKGVRHSHRSLLAESADFLEQLGGREGSTLMQTFPIAHIGGDVCVIFSIGEGVPTVFLEAWHGPQAAAAIARHRVTGMGSTPFFVETLLRAHDEGADLSSLRRVMTGGAAVDPAVIEAADARGVFVFRSYGSTEHPTATGTAEGEALVHRARTDGRPSRGSEVLVVDEGGQPVAPGRRGEVLLRGPEQCTGYRDDAADAEAFRDGWFRTGDLGRIDADGRLTITGRIKQIIIRGGENISVAEVEDAVRAHPAVRDCAVVGVPAPRYGERAAAVVVTGTGGPLGLGDLRDHFAGLGLARFKVPEFVLTVDELPHNAIGKVDRARLLALVETHDPFPAGT